MDCKYQDPRACLLVHLVEVLGERCSVEILCNSIECSIVTQFCLQQYELILESLHQFRSSALFHSKHNSASPLHRIFLCTSFTQNFHKSIMSNLSFLQWEVLLAHLGILGQFSLNEPPALVPLSWGTWPQKQGSFLLQQLEVV